MTQSSTDPRPLIGLTVDLAHPKPHGSVVYSRYPWYAFRKNYADSLIHAGAVALALPNDSSAISRYLETLEGLLITGGDFDIAPSYYGETKIHPKTSPNQERTDFELALVRAALERDLPVLGICGGQQLIHVALGGTLVQHIPDAYKTPLAHEQPNPRHEVSHSVASVEGTRLHTIMREKNLDTTWNVNSAHHQSVFQPDGASSLRVNAIAPDSVIEGVESAQHRFCLGVQWHPEFEITDQDRALLQAFVEACRVFGMER